MIKKHFSDVKEEKVTMANSVNTTIRWLVTKDDGAENFAMRRFVLGEKGKIGLHGHPEDHEIYVLSGEARVFNDKGQEVIAKEGDVLYVPPDELHAYENTGSEPFEFICVVPILKKKLT
ncbi:MAG: cupin domain-containing protein [Candidatus Odinarchaeota archaeon]